MRQHTIKTITVLSILISALAFGAKAQNCTLQPSGLQAWYRAENNADDQRGVNNGTLQNGTTFAGGQVGQAFSFDGIDDFVNIPASPSLDSLTTQATFEAWVNPQATGGWVFAHRSPAIHESFSVIVDSIGALVMIGGTNVQSPIGFSSSNGTIQINQWQHIAVTINTTTNTAKAYVNGSPVTFTQNLGSGIGGQLRLANSNFLGQREAGNGLYKGLIDEASIYSTELTAAQVSAIFNAGSAGKCLAPTAATVQISGRVTTAKGIGIGKAAISLTDSSGAVREVYTNQSGFYQFDDVQAGETYILDVRHKRYQFVGGSSLLSVNEETSGLNFTALPDRKIFE